MDFVDIITRKKFNQPLSDAEIAFFANAAADPASKDYQLAALLMAIRLNGMDARETAALAVAMAHTGDVLTPDVGGIAVDKHSTGGVADTTTLILVPLAVAAPIEKYNTVDLVPASSDRDGYRDTIKGLDYYDLIVFDNAKKAIYVNHQPSSTEEP